MLFGSLHNIAVVRLNYLTNSLVALPLLRRLGTGFDCFLFVVDNICLGLRMCTGLDLRFSFVVDSCGLVRVRVLFGVIMTLCF